jgi:hypothetical protein
MHEFEALLFSDPKLLADGLDAMRAQCPHFNEWIEKLEVLAQGR